jgi:hypothetical protein
VREGSPSHGSSLPKVFDHGNDHEELEDYHSDLHLRKFSALCDQFQEFTIGKVGTWAYIVHYKQPFASYPILLPKTIRLATCSL